MPRAATTCLRLGLRPAVADGRVYVAGHDGDVQALELESGRELWHVETKLPLSGGPGAGEGLVVAGTSDGDIVALAQDNGAERWRAAVGGEVLAAPVLAGGIVVVRTVDGRLRGLRVADGKEAWVYEQQVPRLTLRGNGAPVVSGDMVVAGFDNGKVSAITLATGELLWSTTVAPSHGRTEIERLVDIDSPVQVTARTSTSSVIRAASRCWRSIPGRSGGDATCRATAGSPPTTRTCMSRLPTARWSRSDAATAPRSGASRSC